MRKNVKPKITPKLHQIIQIDHINEHFRIFFSKMTEMSL